MRKLIIYGNLTRLYQESTFGCYEFQVTNIGVEHPITTIHPASELVTIKACLSGAKAPSQYATQFDVRPQGCGFLITAKYSLDKEPLRGEYSRMECLEPLINAVLGETLSSVASCHQCSEIAANINVDDRIVTEGKVYDIQVKKRAARKLNHIIAVYHSDGRQSFYIEQHYFIYQCCVDADIHGCDTGRHQKGFGDYKRPGRHHRQQVKSPHPPTATAKGGLFIFVEFFLV